MLVHLVRAGRQAGDALERGIEHDGEASLVFDRADEAGRDAALLGHQRGMDLGLQIIAQLGLVDLQIAAYEHQHIGVVLIALIDDRLAGLLLPDVQKVAQILYGLFGRRVHLAQLFHLARLVFDQAGRGFHVGAVVALIAQYDAVLADVGEQHILVRDLAAHHAGVGADRHHLGHAAAREYAVISVVAALIVGLQIGLRGMEGIRVLHRELTHADQAAAAAGLVAELGLYLIDHERILIVAVGDVPGVLHGRLLMRHAQAHLRAGAIGEAQHLAADALVAAGFLPQAGGHGHREEHLLAVDRVHLLAHNGLDLFGDALCDRRERVDAVADVLDITAAHHQRLAGDLAVGGGLLKALCDEIADLHHDRKTSFRVWFHECGFKCGLSPVSRGYKKAPSSHNARTKRVEMLRGTTLLDGLKEPSGSRAPYRGRDGSFARTREMGCLTASCAAFQPMNRALCFRRPADDSPSQSFLYDCLYFTPADEKMQVKSHGSNNIKKANRRAGRPADGPDPHNGRMRPRRRAGIAASSTDPAETRT